MITGLIGGISVAATTVLVGKNNTFLFSGIDFIFNTYLHLISRYSTSIITFAFIPTFTVIMLGSYIGAVYGRQIRIWTGAMILAGYTRDQLITVLGASGPRIVQIVWNDLKSRYSLPDDRLR